MAAVPAQPGRIEVICGCMFAGKTGLLIERLEAALRDGRRVVAFKHAIDDRYGPDRLVTHDRRSFAAATAASSEELLSRTDGYDLIGIDEGHFFGRGLTACVRALAARGQRVIVAGLHNDAWGRPFPPFPELRAVADEVRLLTAPCTVCGAAAEFSQRMVPVTDPLMVGGLGEYEPRCRECFKPLPAPAPAYSDPQP